MTTIVNGIQLSRVVYVVLVLSAVVGVAGVAQE